MVKVGLIPTRISALGIEFSQTDQATLLRILTAAIIYFLLAFLVYALSDFWSYRINNFMLQVQMMQQRLGTLNQATEKIRKVNQTYSSLIEELKRINDSKPAEIERILDVDWQVINNYRKDLERKLNDQEELTREMTSIEHQMGQAVEEAQQLLEQREQIDPKELELKKTPLWERLQQLEQRMNSISTESSMLQNEIQSLQKSFMLGLSDMGDKKSKLMSEWDTIVETIKRQMENLDIQIGILSLEPMKVDDKANFFVRSTNPIAILRVMYEFVLPVAIAIYTLITLAVRLRP